MKMLRDMQRLGIGIDRRADVPVRETGAAGQLSALSIIANDVDTLITRIIYGESVDDVRRKVAGYLERALAVPQSEPTWPTLKPAEETQALYEAAAAPKPAPKCNASNPDGSYLCTNEPGHSGDHVHAFINPDGERDFYFWPIKPAPACEAPPPLPDAVVLDAARTAGSDKRGREGKRMSEREMSQRERAVRQAIISLGEVGMKIESLAVHPLVFCEMVAEWPMQINLVREPSEHPQSTYCDIPVNQVVAR